MVHEPHGAAPRTRRSARMGLFSKAKKSMADAAASGEAVIDFNQQQAAAQQPGMIGVKGMGPIAADPAAFGGPSTKPLSEDDPMLQPVNGVSLEMYGKAAAQAQARNMNTEAGM